MAVQAQGIATNAAPSMPQHGYCQMVNSFCKLLDHCLDLVCFEDIFIVVSPPLNPLDAAAAAHAADIALEAMLPCILRMRGRAI